MASPLKRSLSQSLCFQIIKNITFSNIALNSTVYAMVEIIGHHNIDISQSSYCRSNQYQLPSLCLPLHTVATVNMHKLTTHNPLKTPASHLQFNAEDMLSWPQTWILVIITSEVISSLLLSSLVADYFQGKVWIVAQLL